MRGGRRDDKAESELDPYLLLLVELVVRAQKRRGARDPEWVSLDQMIEVSKALARDSEAAIRERWDIAAADRKLVDRREEGPTVELRLTRRGKKLSELL